MIDQLACAPELEAGLDEEEDLDPMVDEGGPQVDHMEDGEGVVRTHVDATAEDAWVYLSLADGAQLQVDAPLSDPSWDLAFQRFNIKLNGGISGSGEVEAATVLDVELEDVELAPADGYLSDQADGDDEDENPDYALHQWYEYNVMTHVLTPRAAVYVIRTGEGEHYKLQLVDYYDDAGTSGHPTFRWARVAAP